MMKFHEFIIIGLLVFGCGSTKLTQSSKEYESESLVIQQVTDHVYQHTSYLDTKSFGKVPCNGMIVFDKKEAIVFDTPTESKASLELINWIEAKLNCTVKAVIPTHFHDDCLGGLSQFHQHGIPSYASNLTIIQARLNNATLPQKGFDSLLRLQVGRKEVIAEYAGEGHTKDNIIGYFPNEKLMFGGCLIKEAGAGKGNLADANVAEWPLTVIRLKEKYPDAKVVIPGHGKRGGAELLDYTINLFKPR